MSNIHWVDLFILILLALGLFRGYQTGVVRQAVGIAGVFVSFGLAVQLMSEVGAVAAASLPIAPSAAPLVGFVLVFLGAQILVRALVHVAESVLEALRLSVLNRLAGGLFGAFQAALLASLLFVLADPMGLPEPATRREAQFYRPVAELLPATWDYVAARVPQLQRFSEEMGERVEGELF